MQIRRTAATLTTAAALSLTGIAGAAPASAAHETVGQDGLVNVAVDDVIVQLPIGIAANVCDIPIAVLSAQAVVGDVDCEAVADPDATFGGGGNNDNNNRQQNGLVNVSIGDLVIQAPVGVAANICGIPVAVLSLQLRAGDTECDAETTPRAQA